MGTLEMGLKGWVEVQQRQKSRALLLPPPTRTYTLGQPSRASSLPWFAAWRCGLEARKRRNPWSVQPGGRPALPVESGRGLQFRAQGVGSPVALLEVLS